MIRDMIRVVKPGVLEPVSHRELSVGDVERFLVERVYPPDSFVIIWRRQRRIMYCNGALYGVVEIEAGRPGRQDIWRLWVPAWPGSGECRPVDVDMSWSTYVVVRTPGGWFRFTDGGYTAVEDVASATAAGICSSCGIVHGTDIFLWTDAELQRCDVEDIKSGIECCLKVADREACRRVYGRALRWFEDQRKRAEEEEKEVKELLGGT